jgi:hypothetical protein
MKKYRLKNWEHRINEQYKYEGTNRLKEIMDDVSESYEKTSFVYDKAVTECISEDKDKVYTFNADTDMFYYVHNITGSIFSAHYPFEIEEGNELNLLVKSER